MGSENGRFVKRFGLGEAVVFCRFWEGNARSNDLGSFFFFFRVVKRQGQVLFSKQTEVIFSNLVEWAGSMTFFKVKNLLMENSVKSHDD